MAQTYTSQIISADGKDGFFVTYFKACGALWHVCYNKLHPFGEEGEATKEVDGKIYSIRIETVDADGRVIEPDKDAKFIRFWIESNDGNVETMKTIESQLVQRLRDIQEKNLEFAAAKPSDIDVR